MLDRGGTQAFFQRCCKVFQNHNDFGARVLELMLQLAGGVQRIDVDQCETGPQDTGNGNWVLHHVGQHHGNPVAFDQAKALQVNAKGPAEFLNLSVADFLAQKTKCTLVGELLKALFHHLDH